MDWHQSCQLYNWASGVGLSQACGLQLSLKPQERVLVWSASSFVAGLSLHSGSVHLPPECRNRIVPKYYITETEKSFWPQGVQLLFSHSCSLVHHLQKYHCDYDIHWQITKYNSVCIITPLFGFIKLSTAAVSVKILLNFIRFQKYYSVGRVCNPLFPQHHLCPRQMDLLQSNQIEARVWDDLVAFKIQYIICGRSSVYVTRKSD